MKFGTFNSEECLGAILAHSVQLAPEIRLKKGITIDQNTISELLKHGVVEITVAKLEADDVHENEASTQIASWLVNRNIRGDRAFTGRVNLYANQTGLFSVDPMAIDRFNAVDPAITIATLKNNIHVDNDSMVATIKIIPYGVSATSLERVKQVCAKPILSVHPYRNKRIGLIATVLPSVAQKVYKKTRRVLEQRLVPSQSEIVEYREIAHTIPEVRDAVREISDRCDILILFGASAISDELDVIPAGVKEAGGEVIRFGMPVDPGNLLMFGRMGSVDIIGAPGCARSPVENGFDWVLQRMLADLAVDGVLISTMGVGGLLKEIVSRPQPRQSRPAEKPSKIGAIVLAAGQSRRMGTDNKLTARLDGKSLVRTVVDVTLAAIEPTNVVVVTGHEAEAIQSELSAVDVRFAHNQNYAEGLSTSLQTGIKKLPKGVDGALVMLADMPKVTREDLQKIVAAFENSPPGSIIVSTHGGKRGNPVLWPRSYFNSLMKIQGDVGARHILGKNEENLVEVELGQAASFDIDTPETLAAAGGSHCQ